MSSNTEEDTGPPNRPIAVRLPADLLKQLNAEAARLGIGRSALVVLLLRSGLPTPGTAEQLSLDRLTEQTRRRR